MGAPRSSAFAALALSLLLSACVSVGKDFDPSLVTRLTPGISTLDDAVRLLGKPTGITQHPDGSQSASWVYTSHGLGTSVVKTLAVHFDSAGHVQ